MPKKTKTKTKIKKSKPLRDFEKSEKSPNFSLIWAGSPYSSSRVYKKKSRNEGVRISKKSRKGGYGCN